MTASESAAPPLVEWAAAGVALAGPSGDRAVVAPFPGGVLVAVIDGLGHGADAAESAEAAARVLEADAGCSVIELVQRCHVALRKLRGAVMSLAELRATESTVTWMGVGNVEAELWSAAPAAPASRIALTTRGGVVGYQLPALRATTHPVQPGDLLLLATDGIRSGFSAALVPSQRPQQIADDIVARHARSSDDALVLVVRLLGQERRA